MFTNHNFLFSSFDSKQVSTTRKVHIKRLYDILEACIQRGDFDRAKRAWCILIRCKEFQWEDHWRTGLYIINEGNIPTQNSSQRVDYLRAMMQRDIDKEVMLKEIILLLITSGQYQEARDELDLYLPSFPYQDNPILHIYAGLLSLQLAQEHDGSYARDSPLLRDAQTHFNQAVSIDPLNAVAQAFLQKTYAFQKQTNDDEAIDSENEDTVMSTSETTPRQKRVKTGFH